MSINTAKAPHFASQRFTKSWTHGNLVLCINYTDLPVTSYGPHGGFYVCSARTKKEVFFQPVDKITDPEGDTVLWRFRPTEECGVVYGDICND